MRKSIAPWAALAGSLALTLAAAAFLYTTARGRERTRFARAAYGVRERIVDRLEATASVLRGAAALLATYPDTSAAQFHAYVEALDLPRHHPGLQGIAFARAISRREAPQIEAELHERGFLGLKVWPESGREARSAIVFIEPLDRRNRAALGYDMLTEPTRRAAMERARIEKAEALSGKVQLVQEIDPQRQAGFILYLPVYRPVRGGSAFLGWVGAPFRADDLFRALTLAEPDPQVDFQVYDGPQADPALLLHDRDVKALPGAMQETGQLRFGGRVWTLVFTALPALRSGTTGPPVGALIAGVLISGLIFLLTYLEAQARSRAEEAVSELQRTLDERARIEEQLREESRINSILRRLGIALASELDPDRLARLVVHEGMALTGAQFGVMIDASGPDRRVLAKAGEIPGGSQIPEETLASLCAVSAAVRIDDASRDPRLSTLVRKGSFLSAPITSRSGGELGGLSFGHGAADHFTEQHERLLLGLAAQASIALDNARLLRDLRDADRRKDEFLAVLGHELRNPLAPVVTALEVVRRDPSARDRQLTVIERQVRHMVRIVDDLLDVSRISRGKIELRKQPLSVRDALARAAETVAADARSRDQRLTVSTPEEPLRIEADPVRLEQILGNLLTNAIKYTPPGGEVELSAREEEGDLVIEVRDTGIGVPAEALPGLFEPFVQVPGAKDYARGGLGIGLALVKGLVQLHGGAVSVRSEGTGKGTTFTVVLPGVTRGETAPQEKPRPPPVRRGRVLVVDDNTDAALTLAEAVAMDGHDVRVAHEAVSALEQARTFLPDVVLLDIGLPGMDGYGVVERMREMPQTRNALIVALTGFGQSSDRERALRAGFDEHLVKPAELEVVQAVLRRRLDPDQVDTPLAGAERREPRAR